jgi:hypothetical protein
MTREDFARACKQRVDQDTRGDPIYASQLNAILDRINDPSAPSAALDDVVTQSLPGAGYDLYDTAALYHVGLQLNPGWAVIAQILLDAAPHRASQKPVCSPSPVPPESRPQREPPSAPDRGHHHHSRGAAGSATHRHLSTVRDIPLTLGTTNP